MAAIDPVTGAEELAGKLIDLFAKHGSDKAALASAIQSGELQLLLGQQATNQEEAKNTNWFVAGWRPMAGWVGVISLALVYWPKAIALSILWCIQAYHAIKLGLVIPPYPDLGLTDILGLLGSLLGIGGMRSIEKIKGAEGNR